MILSQICIFFSRKENQVCAKSLKIVINLLIYNFILTALEEATGKWKISFSTYECSRVYWVRDKVIMFNATSNNISVISWRSVSLVETGENH